MGRRMTGDNPVILANRKAKKLASLLKRQKGGEEARESVSVCGDARILFRRRASVQSRRNRPGSRLSAGSR